MDVQINGCRIHYELEGKGEPPIMTLHGGPGLSDGSEARKWVGPLTEEHLCVFYDHRGNGRSEDPPEETLTHAQFVADAEALRAHLGFDKMILFGGSYGGYFALEYALTYPDRVTHLILRGTAAWGGPPDEALETALARGVRADKEVLRRLFDGRVSSNEEYQDLFRLIYPLYSTQYDPAMLEKAMASRHWHYKTHNKVYGVERKRYDLRDRLKDIRVPTLVLVGRHDWITPPKYSEEIAAGIPGAQLHIFEDAGHAVHSDVPDEFFKTIRAFLAHNTS